VPRSKKTEEQGKKLRGKGGETNKACKKGKNVPERRKRNLAEPLEEAFSKIWLLQNASPSR